VQSEVGHGSEFLITLPVRQAQEPAENVKVVAS
jgi:signal transduction histidine kinase